MRVPAKDETHLPRRSPGLFRAFRWYARRYVRRHFHAVRLSRRGPLPELDRRPVVVVLNHPSWWDPLIGLVLSGRFPTWREHYAPIDTVGLEQYRFLERIGFFGIDSRATRGALGFFRTGRLILSRAESVLWITAQGEFADPRRRPIALMPGVGHLAHALDGFIILPLGIEYPFWNDRCPEVLVRFGRPVAIGSGPRRSPRDWTALIEDELRCTLDALAAESLRRDPDEFVTLLGGTAGVGGVYDIWRRLRSGFGGASFHAEHSVRSSAVVAPAPGTDRPEPE